MTRDRNGDGRNIVPECGCNVELSLASFRFFTLFVGCWGERLGMHVSLRSLNGFVKNASCHSRRRIPVFLFNDLPHHL